MKIGPFFYSGLRPVDLQNLWDFFLAPAERLFVVNISYL